MTFIPAPAPASSPMPEGPRVGYVLKMYPRFSETFVVNEILALERQGLALDIFLCGRRSMRIFMKPWRLSKPV